LRAIWLRNRHSFPERVIAVCTVAILAYAFNCSYEAYVAPRYEFMGMGFRKVDPQYVLMSWIYALVPGLFLPLNLQRPSQVFLYVQYFIFYVPFVFSAYHVTQPFVPHPAIFQLVSTVFLSMMLLVIGWTIPLRKYASFPTKPSSYWSIFLFLFLGFLTLLLITYKDNLKLVNFDDVYELREAAGEISNKSILGSRFTAYALTWVQGCLAPIAFAVAVFNRKWHLAVLSALPFLLIYMIQGSKVALIAPLFTIFFYFWATRLPKYAFVTFSLTLTGLLIVPYAISFFGYEEWNTPYLLLVNTRTFTIPQMVSVQFFDFFRTHTNTFGGHIPGVDLIFPYQFKQGLPYEIGWYYFDRPVGANVGIWAGDGIASFGLIGIPLFTLFLIAFFRVIDSLTSHLKTSFVIVSMAYLASIFANVQINVVIGTNGLFLSILFLMFMPKRGTGRALHRS
jgi:oligosaccharide repeat unit polymerase